MKVIFVERRLNSNDNTISRAEKKLAKLDRYFNQDAEATVRLSKERELFSTEITVHSSSMFFRSQEKSDNQSTSIDMAADSIEKQILKHRTKLGKRIKEGAFDKNSDSAMLEEPEEELKIVKIKRFDLKPMSPEEAVLQMTMLGHTFYTFKNVEDNGRFSVVYARKNGDYGMIESE